MRSRVCVRRAGYTLGFAPLSSSVLIFYWNEKLRFNVFVQKSTFLTTIGYALQSNLD